ncbi:MAG: BLUF domain-containing protein [Chromatocurvus sp.]
MAGAASNSTPDSDRNEGRDELYHLAYVSTLVAPMPSEDVVELLRVARACNEIRGVTGLLLLRGDSFFQVLEGREDDVHAIFERVVADSRHHRIEVLFEEPLVEREFADWQMGFVELDGVDVSELEGVSDFLSRDADPREMFSQLTRSKRLMLMFRQMC